MELPPPPSSRGDAAAYLKTLAGRLTMLEQRMHELLAKQQTNDEEVEKKRKELKDAITDTGKEAARIEGVLREQVKAIRSLVASFQNSVRQQEMTRLQQRVDAQRYEEYLTKDELQRILTEESANT